MKKVRLEGEFDSINRRSIQNSKLYNTTYFPNNIKNITGIMITLVQLQFQNKVNLLDINLYNLPIYKKNYKGI